MTGENPAGRPTGADDEYDDLNPADAFRVGVLAELSQVREELAGIRRALEAGADVQAEATDGGGELPIACDCGEHFKTLDEAVEHAREDHNAPDAEAIEYLLTGDGS